MENDPQTDATNNVISFHEANRHALNEKLKLMESRVQELESSILEHASNLECLFIETLDQVSWREIEEGLAEFSEFPLDHGTLRPASIKPGEAWLSGGDTSSDERFVGLIDSADEQLELLHEAIGKLQLPR